MVSSRGKSKGCLATFAERKSRLYLAFLIPNRTKDAMHNAIEQLTSNLPEHALKSFTSDRGKEFACYPEVEASALISTLRMPAALGKEGQTKIRMA